MLHDGDLDARVERLAIDLLEEAADQDKAQELAWDWEYLLPYEAEIISITAEALHDCLTCCLDQESKRERMAVLGAEVMDIAIRRAREIARRQIERDME